MPDNQIIDNIMEQLRELRHQGAEHSKALADLGADVRTLVKALDQSDHGDRIGRLEKDFGQIKAYLKVGGVMFGIVWPIIYPTITEFIRSQFK